MQCYYSCRSDYDDDENFDNDGFDGDRNDSDGNDGCDGDYNDGYSISDKHDEDDDDNDIGDCMFLYRRVALEVPVMVPARAMAHGKGLVTKMMMVLMA
jgi:hypothetical protein